MPLNLSFTHIIVMLVVALVVLGPDRLPEAARTMGKWITELRRLTSGLQDEVRDTFGDFAEPFTDLVQSVKGGVADATSGVPSTPPAASTGVTVEPLAASATGSASQPASAQIAGPTVADLPALPTLGVGEPAPGTFSPGPDPAPGAAVFTPLGAPEPGAFTPRP